MTAKAFITSGILEKYAMGMTTEEENKEVLEMAFQHIEVKEELAAIRQTLKGYIVAHQVTPPANLKEKVMAIGDKRVITQHKKETVAVSSKSYSPSSVKKADGKGFSVAGIAAVLLGLALAAACFTAYSFFKDIENSNEKLESVKEEVVSLKKQLAGEKKTSEAFEAKLSFYQARENQIILLKGTSRSPNATATIYWNEVAKAASIDVPALPNLSNGKVAILWVNTGRDVQKLGVLTANEEGALSKLIFIENADSFYVTEEDNADANKPNKFRILMTGS